MRRTKGGIEHVKCLDESILEYVVRHVFLPPKLPDGSDSDPKKDAAVLALVLDALAAFQGCMTPDRRSAVAAVAETVQLMVDVRDEMGNIDETKLEEAMSEISRSGTDSRVLPIHVVSQNAAVLVYRTEHSVHIESFELSPRNKSIMSSPGRLRRYFPGTAITLDLNIFLGADFQTSFTSTLFKLSHHLTPNTRPLVKKAGQSHVEERDTTSPEFVTEFIPAWLGPVSNPAKAHGVWKNTREEVMWRDSLYPWRRSPAWLLTRVLMQLVFSRQSPASDALYKTFMLYLMAWILKRSPANFPSDMIEIMRVKIARRRHKLTARCPRAGDEVLSYVDGVLVIAADELARQQRAIFKQSTPISHMRSLRSLRFHEDVFHCLPDLDSFITSISERNTAKAVGYCNKSSQLSVFIPGVLPECHQLLAGGSECAAANLVAFEDWVAENLDDWIACHAVQPTTCSQLDRLLQKYCERARVAYQGNPEGNSALVLTAVDLWIACDKSAIHCHPLLSGYSPEIPSKLLQGLILPFREQMARLQKAEQYLGQRERASDIRLPSVFTSFGHVLSFGVKFYDKSLSHQALHQRIVAHAESKRKAKIGELEEVQDEFRSLQTLHDCSSCSYVLRLRRDRYVSEHDPGCKRCSYKRGLKSLRIEIYEWPLPKNPGAAKGAVFELDVPGPFSAWREATTFLKLEVLGMKYAEETCPSYTLGLDRYHVLSSFVTGQVEERRICLASSTKPNTVTHRHSKTVPMLTTDDVISNNGLSWNYFDSRKQTMVGELHETMDMVHRCMYRMPAESLSLDKYLLRTSTRPEGLPPNEAIASQSEAPDHISSVEYKALCAMPLGHKIQWMNLLVQLALPEVDFRKAETAVVVLQLISQSGPADKETILRQGHGILRDDGFCKQVVAELRKFSQRIRKNWESSQALATFTFIGTRIISLAESGDVRSACLEFLGEARDISFEWMRGLRAAYQTASDDHFRQEMVHKAAEIALICSCTFDLREQHLDDLLTSQQDASVFLQCCITIKDCLVPEVVKPGSLASLMVLRWKRLCHRAVPALLVTSQSAFVNYHTALDDAIHQSWPEYQRGIPWTTQAQHWLETKTSLSRGGFPVQYNLLTGELLVNGLPLSRLPREVEGHFMYGVLFGKSILDVMPSGLPGMEFSAKGRIFDQVVNIGRQGIGAQADLIVSAEREGLTYHLVPRRVFQGLLPEPFVTEHVHWYCTERGTVGFRPLKTPWVSPSRCWTLSRAGKGWTLQNDMRQMVCRHSTTMREISAIFDALEDVSHLHVALDQVSKALHIGLPRLSLEFDLAAKSSDVQSRQFRDMRVDQIQSTPSLMGLCSKLVLVDGHGTKRMVLIPDGQVTWGNLGKHHVAVTVLKGTSSRVHGYVVDWQLGRLADNGSFRAKIYLAYLHALTSFCIPDPLTSHTGTEQALSILRSAAVGSLSQLSGDDFDLLVKISSLTPSRQFYPREMQVMQSMSWDPKLSFLSQHGEFFVCVKALLQVADKQAVFYPTTQKSSFVEQLLDSRSLDERLLQRDLVNSSWCRRPGFGAERFSTSHDRGYASRDRARNIERSDRCYAMSMAIHSRQRRLPGEVAETLQDNLWRFFQGDEMQGTATENRTVSGPDAELPAFDFNLTWLYSHQSILANLWCATQRAMHNVLAHTGAKINIFQLMAFLSSMAFIATPEETQALNVLAAFALIPEAAAVKPPAFSSNKILDGRVFDHSVVKAIVHDYERIVEQTPDGSLAWNAGETELHYYLRRRSQYAENLGRATADLVRYLEQQWPCSKPNMNQNKIPSHCVGYLDLEKIRDRLQPKFEAWFTNHLLYEYLGKIAQVLWRYEVAPVQSLKPLMPLSERGVSTQGVTQGPGSEGFITVDIIFNTNTPPTGPCSVQPVLHLPEGIVDAVATHGSPAAPQDALQSLLQRLEARAVSDFDRVYSKELEESIKALTEIPGSGGLGDSDADELKPLLEDYQAKCLGHVEALYAQLEASLGVHGRSGRATLLVPRICPVFFVSQLSAKRWKALPEDWKPFIIEYGLAFQGWQRAQRLVVCSCSRSPKDLLQELQNPGHSNWDPAQNPQALLVEIESNLTIRRVQFDIAREMLSPPDGRNSVMQLNMGEGKSSVIVPLVAASLADGARLARVVVTKPQSKQMMQILQARLGGLLDVKIYQLPFSRALHLDADQAAAIANDLIECTEQGGVLLMQPEHILSFKLMGLECLITGKEAVGRQILSTQAYLDDKTRDIVDESDDNFSVKFELVYTMGAQRPIDLSPDRWTFLQAILGIVREVGPGLAESMPHAMEICPRNDGGSFPRLRVFGADAQDGLVREVATRVCETGLPGLPIAKHNEAARLDLFKYLTEARLTAEEVTRVEDPARGLWTPVTKDLLLLLRGLLAGGILGFAFGQKRWRVNYGLDPQREPPTRLAVPYRAKDSPSPRSEFSHPEVILLLTSLTYYYGGLSDDDLFLAFAYLRKSDQPAEEYNAWVEDAPSLPGTFRNLLGVNLRNRAQCITEVFPKLRFAKAAVDFFLSRVVFPKYMKEFPSKLSASGWDIGQIKAHPTTGFSGTADSREVLPLSVTHLDLPDQKHTNALVLGHLLGGENAVELLGAWSTGSGTDAEQLLSLVTHMEPEVQVILDVGAQILELNSLGVAKRWLAMQRASSLHNPKQACVYFDDADEMCVVDKDGKSEALFTSPFFAQLDVCLVFLDESHTRGTDLKLPENYRAAVTLGANLTKDRLVQACMRMRKLGKGQSVIFCIPPEIRVKILQLTNKSPEDQIQVSDVLLWAMAETCADLQCSIPLWAVQGRRFAHQKHLWAQAVDGVANMQQELAERFLEDEAQTIDHLYRPGERPKKLCCPDADKHEEVDLIEKQCAKHSCEESHEAALHEEQERELAPEIEQERQIEKPMPAKPACHLVDRDVRSFSRTGVLKPRSKSFIPAFRTLADTSAAALISDLDQFPQDLLVTRDYARTIKKAGIGAGAEKKQTLDQYKRPVQWILTSDGGGIGGSCTAVVIISPFEAQMLLDDIEEHRKVVMHLYAPRSSSGFEPLENLRLYTVPALPQEWKIPRVLILQLNLFAGQLYISTYDDYAQICDMLGLDWRGDQDGVGADGFITPKTAETTHGFTESPVGFLKVLLTKIRRECETIEKTHMGKLLGAVTLRSVDF